MKNSHKQFSRTKVKIEIILPTFFYYFILFLLRRSYFSLEKYIYLENVFLFNDQCISFKNCCEIIRVNSSRAL